MKVIKLSDHAQFNSDKMKKNNLFQTPRFFCDVYCFEPGQEQKGHVHGDQDKIYLVLEGQGRFKVGAEEQVLGVAADAQHAGDLSLGSVGLDLVAHVPIIRGVE